MSEVVHSLHENFLKSLASRAMDFTVLLAQRKSLLARIYKYYAILGKQ